MPTLQELLETIIASGHLKASRVGPMRTAVKQYSAMFAEEPQACHAETFNLADPFLTEFINRQAPHTLGMDARRNLRNNVRFLLKCGTELGLLTSPRIDEDWTPPRPVSAPWTPHRSWSVVTEPYWLRSLPEKLAQEFADFTKWSTAAYAPGRPSRIKKRPSTMQSYRQMVHRIGGFLVHIQHMDPTELTLAMLTDAKHVQAFIEWFVNQHGKVTGLVHSDLGRTRVISTHWLKDPANTTRLTAIRNELSTPQAVRVKEEAWLSLPVLESTGIRCYPFYKPRLKSVNPTNRRALAKAARTTEPPRPHGRYTFTRTGVRVAYSLMLRLFTRIPMRQRNMREMKLGRNLIERNGSWEIRFSGTELKIDQRNGHVNRVSYTFPPDLQDLLQEWLRNWRPLLLHEREESLVFVNAWGRPFTERNLADAINRTTWRYTGVAVNPHNIRDIWATEYIKATRDIIGAAYMLGDTVQTVLKHYAHLLDADAETRATKWLTPHLNGSHQNPSSNGGHPSLDELLRLYHVVQAQAPELLDFLSSGTNRDQRPRPATRHK